MAEIEKIMKFKKQLAESDQYDIYTQISRLGAQKYHESPGNIKRISNSPEWNKSPQVIPKNPEKTKKGRSLAFEKSAEAKKETIKAVRR